MVEKNKKKADAKNQETFGHALAPLHKLYRIKRRITEIELKIIPTRGEMTNEISCGCRYAE